MALGDVDGDGDLDLVLGTDRGQSLLYLNDGAGRFTDATATHLPLTGDSTRALALGDVDRDGDLDLTLGNNGAQRGHQSLYLNLLRQVDAPLALAVGRTYRLDVYSRPRLPGPSRRCGAVPLLGRREHPVAAPRRLRPRPSHLVALSPFPVPQPAGIESLSFPVPNLPALVGFPLHSQALVIRGSALGRLSNVQVDVIR